MEDVVIDTPSIKLDQFLKWANLAGTGGEAKYMIKNGEVKVNGEREFKRSRMLIAMDIVEVDNVGSYRITHHQ